MFRMFFYQDFLSYFLDLFRTPMEHFDDLRSRPSFMLLFRHVMFWGVVNHSQKKIWILNLSNMSHTKHKVSYAFYRHVAKHVRWDGGFYGGFLHPDEVPFYLPDIITMTSMSSFRRRSFAWSSFSGSWPSAKRHLSNYHRASKLEAISKHRPSRSWCFAQSRPTSQLNLHRTFVIHIGFECYFL